MIVDVHRALIVPAAHAQLARDLCATLAPVGGANMFITGLSADGAEPASHFVTAGMQDEAFMKLLPLTTRNEEGVEATAPGEPETVAHLATQAGMTLTLEEVQALFDACDVTQDEPLARIAQLGLAIVQPAEVA